MSDLAFLHSKQLFAGEEAQVEKSHCLGCLWAAQTGARSRDLGCGCYSAATCGSPRVPAGLGCFPGELCARSWCIPGGRHCSWVWYVLWRAPCSAELGQEGSRAALTGADALGCPCSLLCLWGPHCSTGQGFAPRVLLLEGSTAAALCSSCWPQGKCTCMFPGHQVASGAASTPSPSHSGKWRGTAVAQVSPAGPGPATTRLNNVLWLWELWMRPEHEGHHAEGIHLATNNQS